jgi:hypothetical protein
VEIQGGNPGAGAPSKKKKIEIFNKMLKGGPGKILLCPSKIFLPPNIYKKSQKNKIK